MTLTNADLDEFAGATLHFDVELINISDSPPTANVFKEIDADKDNQLSREEVSAMARIVFFISNYFFWGQSVMAWLTCT